MANQRNKDIIGALPPGVTRIQVQDEAGKTKYRKPSEVKDTDEILLKADGTPTVMRDKPGRKALPEREPANELIAKILEDKREALSSDPLVRSVQSNPESPDVLQQIMLGISEEAASLKFDREEAERKGDETSQISMRRVNALKAAGDTFLKHREQIETSGVDLDSKSFMTVMEFIGETMHTVLVRDCLQRPEAAQTMMTKFATVLNSGEWRAELEAKLRR